VTHAKEMFGICTTKCPSKSKNVMPECTTTDASGANTKTYCSSKWYQSNGDDTFALGPYCISNEYKDRVMEKFNSLQVLESIYESWPVLIICFVGTIIAGFFFLFFLEYFAGILAWSLVAAVVALFAFTGTYAWINFEMLSEERGMSGTSIKAIAGVAWSFAAVTLLLGCCCRKSINLSAGLLKCAAAFLVDVKSQMVSPLFFALFHILYCALWIGVLICVMTIGAYETCEAKCSSASAATPCYVPKTNPFCLHYTWNGEGVARLIVLVLMLFWINGMISALSHFQTSYTAGVWYFSDNDPESGEKLLPGGNTCCDWSLTFKAIAKGIWYHSGSFAFGAMLVSIVQVIRFVLRLVTTKNDDGNGTQRAMLCCAMACFAWLEELVSFVSGQAYIQVALLGVNFCEGGKSAFSISVRNPGRVVLASRFSDMLELLGTGIITTGMVCLGAVLLQSGMVGDVEDVLVPCIVLGVMSFITGLTMMHPYSTATMAILHCFIADEQMSEYCGLAGARHVPPQLSSFVEHLDG